MANHRSNLFLLFSLVLALAGGAVILNFYLNKPVLFKSKAAPETQAGSKTIPQALADVNPASTTSTILAPNGKMTLIVKEEKAKGVVTDTFSTQLQDGSAPVQIYTETLAAGTNISVPYNTFSPDNKYIFLKKATPSGISYFVLKTDGTVFAKDEKTIDFLALFNQKYPDSHKVTEATGWGGMNLIVVNTDNPDGTVSHSFWYDVTSNSFIQLSTRFN